MSVVGASRWYDRVVAGQYNPESDLILNKYCRAFISEVKSLIPTDFYTGYMKHVCIHENGRMKAIHPFTCFDGKCTTRDCSALSSSDISGSLMPFGNIGQRYRRNAAPGLSNKQAHNSVSSWLIDKFGRVMIKRACVLVSSRIAVSEAQGTINATITAASNNDIKVRISFHQRPFNLAHFPNPCNEARAGSFGIYLIVISSLLENAEYDSGFGLPSFQWLSQGIVLRPVEQKREATRGPRSLVAVGTFYTLSNTKAGDQFELPEKWAVDWIVL